MRFFFFFLFLFLFFLSAGNREGAIFGCLSFVHPVWSFAPGVRLTESDLGFSRGGLFPCPRCRPGEAAS